MKTSFVADVVQALDSPKDYKNVDMKNENGGCCLTLFSLYFLLSFLIAYKSKITKNFVDANKHVVETRIQNQTQRPPVPFPIQKGNSCTPYKGCINKYFLSTYVKIGLIAFLAKR